VCREGVWVVVMVGAHNSGCVSFAVGRQKGQGKVKGADVWVWMFRIRLGRVGLVALGGLVASVLATGPKVRGFKQGRGRWILRVIKSVALLPSEGK
jgi:hypothetical protein